MDDAREMISLWVYNLAQVWFKNRFRNDFDFTNDQKNRFNCAPLSNATHLRSSSRRALVELSQINRFHFIQDRLKLSQKS